MSKGGILKLARSHDFWYALSTIQLKTFAEQVSYSLHHLEESITENLLNMKQGHYSYFLGIFVKLRSQPLGRLLELKVLPRYYQHTKFLELNAIFGS